MEKFPVLGTNESIPYGLIEKHSMQAWMTHGQKLETLASRGGLDWCELYCVLRDKSFNKLVTESLAKDWVLGEVYKYNLLLTSSCAVIPVKYKKPINLDLRPCEVMTIIKGKRCVVNAHFHRWFEGYITLIDVTKSPRNTQIKCVKAIVEFEDGTVGETHYDNIRFTDRSDKNDY